MTARTHQDENLPDLELSDEPGVAGALGLEHVLVLVPPSGSLQHGAQEPSVPGRLIL